MVDIIRGRFYLAHGFNLDGRQVRQTSEYYFFKKKPHSPAEKAK